MKFNTDKTARFDGGAFLCQGSMQTETGAWDFNSDQSKLTLGSAHSPIAGLFDLTELSSKALKVSITNTYSTGTTEVTTTTFTAF